MKNNFSEKGISTILILVIIVIAAVIGNIAIYYYIQKGSPETKETSKMTDKNIQTTTEQKNEEKTSDGEENIKDCGVVGIIKVSSADEKPGIANITEAEDSTIKAWECFTDYLKNCASAKIKLTPDVVMGHMPNGEDIVSGNDEYCTIIQKDGDNCKISGPTNNFLSEKNPILKESIMITCEIPLKYIDFGYEEAFNIYGKKFMQGFSVTGIFGLGVGEHEFQYPDGTKGIIVCK